MLMLGTHLGNIRPALFGRCLRVHAGARSGLPPLPTQCCASAWGHRLSHHRHFLRLYHYLDLLVSVFSAVVGPPAS
ncbi:hypothetical protein LZ31DRAFT_383959 [Colletotrichum somersetense]|nr:hypothetical protein LZ31DRAFT_383959 [Colletotrichum somersetense]